MYGLAIDKSAKEKLYAANGAWMMCLGRVDMAVRIPGHRRISVDAIFSDALKDDMIIGWSDLQRLNVIPGNFPTPIASNMCAAASADPVAPSVAATSCSDVEARLIREFDDVLADTSCPEPMRGPRMHNRLHPDASGRIQPKSAC